MTDTPTQAVAEADFQFFPWTTHFDTDIDVIDRQHRVLVNLLNRLAQHYIDGANSDGIFAVLAELADYANYHFETEERIWLGALGGDERVVAHQHTHQAFFAHIAELQTSQKPLAELLDDLFAYLSNWLAFHILDSDKRVAKAVRAVEAGVPHADAHAQADTDMQGAAATLIQAVLDMYRRLSTQALHLMHERHARTQVERTLALARQERDRQQLAAELAAQLLVAPHDQLDANLQTLLQRTGEALQVDRALIFLMNENGQKWSGSHAWCQQGVPPLDSHVSNQALSAHTEWWIAQLRTQGSIRIDDTRHMPPEAAGAANLLHQSGTQSVCSVPLWANDLLLGFIALDAVRTPRCWQEADMTWLRLMASFISTCLVRHRAEEDKRASLQRFEVLFESIADAVIVADDATGTVVSANAQAAALFGRPVHALVGLHFTQLHPPQIHATEPDQFEQRVDTGAQGAYLHETLIRHADGHDIAVEISSGRRYQLNGRQYQVGVFRDITERKAQQSALVAAERRLSTLLNKVPVGLVAADVSTQRFNLVNDAFCQMLGYDRDELLGMTPAHIHPADELPRIRAEFERIAKGELPLAQNITVLRKDGTRLLVDVQPVELELDGKPTALAVFIDVTRRP
jgi:hemerythrin-like metal-binding protein/PAS domain S-box-containing protein